MDYQRAVEPPNRGFVLGATIGGGALGACAMIAVAIIVRMPSAPSPASPAPAPIAQVTVVPAAPVIVQVPAPAPPSVEPPPVPPVRATTPFLQAHCFSGEDAPDLDRSTCTWDDGFPAISPDGKTIATKYADEDGGRGNPNLTIEFFDVATGKRVRAVRILTGDEYDAVESSALVKRIAGRIAKVHTALDGYRTLQALDGGEDQNLEGTRLRVERHEATLRVIDTTTQHAIYHRNFDASVIHPDHKADPDRECSGLGQLGDIPVWWDEPTRTVVTTVYYAYGGCMCGGQTDTFVKRLR